MNNLKPMKISHASDEVVATLLKSDAWVLEQKMDGARVMVHVTVEGGLTRLDWRASSGEPLKFAAAAQHVERLSAQLTDVVKDGEAVAVTFDGELIVSTGVLHVFDLPYLELAGGVAVDPSKPYYQRRMFLDLLFQEREDSHLTVVRSAIGTEAKAELWTAINASGVEGAILKREDAPYESGVRTKNQFKAKLVKTADLVVLSAERTFKPGTTTVHTGSAGLGVWMVLDGYAKVVPIASASLIGKDLSIEPGDVVEVAYLYRDAKGGLIQPRIIAKRRAEEKRAEDCTDEQFPTYSRAAV